MSGTQVPLLAPVALAVDLPAEGLTRGQMGTVVERLSDDQDEALLVEFSGENGETYAMVPVKADQLIVLHRQIDAA
jgi:hypothetical protein